MATKAKIDLKPYHKSLSKQYLHYKIYLLLANTYSKSTSFLKISYFLLNLKTTIKVIQYLYKNKTKSKLMSLLKLKLNLIS